MDNYAEYSSITYLDIIGVLVNLGGLASALLGPIAAFMDHIASESYISRIVAGLYTRRQKMSEFLTKHTNSKPHIQTHLETKTAIMGQNGINTKK